jgi:hypothetical protein
MQPAFYLLLVFRRCGADQAAEKRCVAARRYDKRLSGYGINDRLREFVFLSGVQTQFLRCNYVFLARGDGDDAWMNLGGRDVRLQQVKLLTSENRKLRRYYYRLGRLRLTVVIENFRPDEAQVKEGDSMFKMTITLRQGNAQRIVKAVGDSDC